VRVFGADGIQRQAFFAYAPAFTGGVFVAAGDIDGDGLADIVTGADAGGGPHVVAFSGADLHVLRSFYAYSPFFFGGVRVAVGDLDLDGYAEIITAAGPGGGPHVRVFDGATGTETTGFYAFNAAFAGGVFVAAPAPQSRMNIDLPAAGATLPPMFPVSGWAAEGLAVTDSGIDGVHVWAIPVGGGAPIFVGATTVGLLRPDVAALFGGIYADSGFNLVAGPLPAGTYDLAVFVHSSRTGTFIDRRVVRIVVTS
jgi:FG-GAP repeat protein